MYEIQYYERQYSVSCYKRAASFSDCTPRRQTRGKIHLVIVDRLAEDAQYPRAVVSASASSRRRSLAADVDFRRGVRRGADYPAIR